MKSLLLILIFLLPNGFSATPYNSKVLKTKDYEEMKNLINKHIKHSQQHISNDSQNIDSSVLQLQKGLKILLMRPDEDAINPSLMLILKNEIIKHRSFMSVLYKVIKESLSELKSKKKSIAYQASLIYLMENSLSYLHSINNKESTRIVTTIKKANLKMSEKIYNYLLLEMGREKSASPSYIATQILNKRLKERRKLAQKIKTKRKPSSFKPKKLQKENTKSYYKH